jgi:Calcineurin-like phosphoesterase
MTVRRWMIDLTGSPALHLRPGLGCANHGHIMTMTHQQATREDAQHPATPFTLVVSDVHAFPEFLENALRRSGFRAGIDHLVFAGDLLDRGGRPGVCLERLDELDAEMLLGDHDHATMLGYFIGEQSPASKNYRRALLERFAGGSLNLATTVGGVLISHAGFSRAFARDFAMVGRDPVRLAQLINEEFRGALERQLATGSTQPEPRTLDGHSPMWLRVDDIDVGPERLLDGVEQIAGHTTPSVFRHWTEADFRAAGMHLVDPGSYGLRSRDHPRHYRYGTIRGGVVSVAAGVSDEAIVRGRG